MHFSKLLSSAAPLLSLVTPALATTSAGCGLTPTIQSGVRTLTIQGTQRQYTIAVPANYNNTHPYRLVYGLHWATGTMQDVATGQTVEKGVWAYYGLQQLANNSAIFVAPQGIGNAWYNTNGSDVAFMDAIMTEVEAGLCVNQTQRFATGFSHGAEFTYALACQRANKFRAVAVLDNGGPINDFDMTKCTTPIAWLGVFGNQDQIANGRSARDNYIKVNNCTTVTPKEPATNSHTHYVTEYPGCAVGYPVIWAVFDGGHIPAPYDGGTGNSGSKAFTPALTWQLFTRF